MGRDNAAVAAGLAPECGEIVACEGLCGGGLVVWMCGCVHGERAGTCGVWWHHKVGPLVVLKRTPVVLAVGREVWGWAVRQVVVLMVLERHDWRARVPISLV